MFVDDLKPGEWAVIEEMGNDTASVKLIELGCLPGERVMLKRTAPFRDPIVIEVGGSLISLRKSEAKVIRIKRPVA
ncbi:MAG: ferrous iron transport protein A [Bacteroidota bacterium]|nr:ferrous iron transport protein A [Bacteroidota bacterium]